MDINWTWAAAGATAAALFIWLLQTVAGGIIGNAASDWVKKIPVLKRLFPRQDSEQQIQIIVHSSDEYKKLTAEIEHLTRQQADLQQSVGQYPEDGRFSRQLQETEQLLSVKQAERREFVRTLTELLKKIRHDNPYTDTGHPRLQKARELILLGELDAALAELNPDDWRREEIQMHKLRAEIILLQYSRQAQRIPDARAEYRRILELAPTAQNLWEYADFLREHGQYTEAADYYRRALAAYRLLTENGQDGRVAIAKIQNNLANVLARNPQHYREAEQLYRQVWESFQELARQQPEVFEQDVAITLNNLAILLSDDSSRRSQAKEYYDKALTLFRKLARQQPEIFEQDVAMTLDNLANLLAQDPSRRRDAEQYYGEALDLRRKLAQQQPEIFEQDVATTLNNLAALLAKDPFRRRDAEQYYGEALTLRRKLAQQQPEVFEQDVAMTLDNLASLLAKDPSRRSEAEQYYGEALDLRRKLAQEQPEIFKQDFAQTLNNLAALLAEDPSHRHEAKEYYDKALTLCRKLAQQQPEIFEQDVAATLNNLAILLSNDPSRRSEAEQYYGEALAIRRKLARQQPEIFEQYVADTLNNLALLLSNDPSRCRETEQYYNATLALYDKLAPAAPHIYQPTIAKILFNLAVMYHRYGESAAAIPLLSKAQALLAPYAQQHPEYFGALQRKIYRLLQAVRP